jgi:glycosyltransferase involved in cell wall biosynthesis
LLLGILLVSYLMPPITALLHTANDTLRLGRALETLRACEEIIIVDHDSSDTTLRIAREYGAQILPRKSGEDPGNYLQSSRYNWILCLDPMESVTEGLEATLYEWRSATEVDTNAAAFAVSIREETSDGWRDIPTPQTRLVTKTWNRWNGRLPADDPSAITLEGTILRFIFP